MERENNEIIPNWLFNDPSQFTLYIIYNTPIRTISTDECFCPMKPIRFIYTYQPMDTSRNNECPITFNTFNEKSKYMKCSTCKYNFDSEALEKYLNNYRRRCPMCRNKWTQFVKFINY